MARQTTRSQITARAVQARQPSRSGGITAPRARTGLGQARPVPAYKAGVGSGRLVPHTGASPAAPTAPAPAPGPRPTPWSAAYEQSLGNSGKTYADTIASLGLKEQAAKQDFGLDPGFNDYKSNPYSRAALLEQSFQTANRGSVNSAGLQLYSGSTSNHLAANRSTNDANRDSLMKTYAAALQEITDARTEAAQRKAEDDANATWKSVEDAEEEPLDSETAPAGAGKKGKGKGGRKKQTQQLVRNNRPAKGKR